MGPGGREVDAVETFPSKMLLLSLSLSFSLAFLSLARASERTCERVVKLLLLLVRGELDGALVEARHGGQDACVCLGDRKNQWPKVVQSFSFPLFVPVLQAACLRVPVQKQKRSVLCGAAARPRLKRKRRDVEKRTKK